VSLGGLSRAAKPFPCSGFGGVGWAVMGAVDWAGAASCEARLQQQSQQTAAARIRVFMDGFWMTRYVSRDVHAAQLNTTAACEADYGD
jgi:hypothetical protein